MINIYSVTEISKYLKNIINDDQILRGVYVKGEISNLKFHSSGTIYFSLKDESSTLNCIIFKSSQYKLVESLKLLKDGSSVNVFGRLSIYQKQSQYTLIVGWFENVGLGEAWIEFNQLKERYEKQGLFSESRKKKLPTFPKNIAIITASTGDALHDITSTINRRWPLTNLYLFPTKVQGDNAENEIAREINRVSDFNIKFDVCILARGGGSFEDLSVFNKPVVAKAIFMSLIPIITGIGHEPDFTISDYIADKRGPTPTGAAEIATPDVNDVRSLISQYKSKLVYKIYEIVSSKYNILDIYKKNYIFKNPEYIFSEKIREVDDLTTKLNLIMISIFREHFLAVQSLQFKLNAWKPQNLIDNKKYMLELYSTKARNNIINIISNKKNHLHILRSSLNSVNPESVLKRGFSIIKNENNLVIKNPKNLKINDKIIVKFYDGKITAKVTSLEGKKNDK